MRPLHRSLRIHTCLRRTAADYCYRPNAAVGAASPRAECAVALRGLGGSRRGRVRLQGVGGECERRRRRQALRGRLGWTRVEVSGADSLWTDEGSSLRYPVPTCDSCAPPGRETGVALCWMRSGSPPGPSRERVAPSRNIEVLLGRMRETPEIDRRRRKSRGRRTSQNAYRCPRKRAHSECGQAR